MTTYKRCHGLGCDFVLSTLAPAASIFDGGGLRRADYCDQCWPGVVEEHYARAAAPRPALPPRRLSASQIEGAKEQERLRVRAETQELLRQSRAESQAAGREVAAERQAERRQAAQRLLDAANSLRATVEPDRPDPEREALKLEQRAELIAEEGLAAHDRDQAAARFRHAADLREAARTLRDGIEKGESND